jgi:hypothetical protein
MSADVSTVEADGRPVARSAPQDFVNHANVPDEKAAAASGPVDDHGAPIVDEKAGDATEVHDHRIDGGWRAWSLVLAGFMINSCGLGYIYAL